jgi:hypothetical protein
MTLESVKEPTEKKETVKIVNTMGQVPPCELIALGESECVLAGGNTLVYREVVTQEIVADLSGLMDAKKKLQETILRATNEMERVEKFLAIIRDNAK